MKLTLVRDGALIVQTGDSKPFMFGVPKNISQTLTEVGLDVPDIIFTTSYSSPGLGHLGKAVIRYKEEPLNLEAIKATPLKTPNGTDYIITSHDDKILFTQKPNLTPQETYNYSLVVSCKESMGEFPAHVVFLESLLETVKEGVLNNGVLMLFAEKETTETGYDDLEGKPKKKQKVADDSEIVDAEKEAVKNKAGDTASDFLVAEDPKSPSTWHLQVSRKGKPDMDLIGGAAAALGPKGFHGNKYEGPNKEEAKKKLRALYKKLDKPIPEGLSTAMKELDAYDLTEAVKEQGVSLPEAVFEVDSWCSVYKDAEGNERWASISSVATWDKHEEFFTTEAMDWAIKFNKLIGKEVFGGNLGPLRYRHIPGVDGGYCDVQLRIGDFLFEAGGFNDNEIGNSMKRRLKESPEGWGISLGLLFRPSDLINGIYKRAIAFERSMTPKPANPMAVLTIEQ